MSWPRRKRGWRIEVLMSLGMLWEEALITARRWAFSDYQRNRYATDVQFRNRQKRSARRSYMRRKEKTMKEVNVIAHTFDCLPGHIALTGRGSGSNWRVAVTAAVRNALEARELRQKQVNSFKISVVIIK